MYVWVYVHLKKQTKRRREIGALTAPQGPVRQCDVLSARFDEMLSMSYCCGETHSCVLHSCSTSGITSWSHWLCDVTCSSRSLSASTQATKRVCLPPPHSTGHYKQTVKK